MAPQKQGASWLVWSGMRVVVIIMFRAAGMWQWRVIKAEHDCCVWKTSWRAGATWTVQAIDRRQVVEGSNCGVAQEKRYAAAVKWQLDGLRKMSETPPGSL